jgi:hypothetical protein
LKDPGVDGRIILISVLKSLDGGMRSIDWIDLAQDRDRCSIKCGEFLD